MAAFEAWLVFFILVVNVVGELQRKRTFAASRGFLAAARLSCIDCPCILVLLAKWSVSVHLVYFLKCIPDVVYCVCLFFTFVYNIYIPVFLYKKRNNNAESMFIRIYSCILLFT